MPKRPGQPHSVRAPRIDDVALRAGVSTATVSRTLSGRGYVASSTRERVLAAAGDLGYAVSPHASALASGRTRRIGVVAQDLRCWSTSSTIAVVSAELSRAGYDVLLVRLDDEGRDGPCGIAAVAARVDGVLLLQPAAAARTLPVRGRPLVVVGSRVAGVPGVRIDEGRAISTAVEHLAQQGHRRIAAVLGERSGDAPPRTAPGAGERAFRAAMAAVGLEVPEQRVARARDGGGRAAVELLSAAPSPTAVVAESDELAIGALCALRERGIAVPREVSVIGVDDHEMACAVDLTTIARPVEEQARAAARLLLDVVNDAGERTADGPRDIVLDVRLVVRGSTGPPAPAPLPAELRHRAPEEGGSSP